MRPWGAFFQVKPILGFIAEELRPYFESYTVNIEERRWLNDEYLELCQHFLEQLNVKVISSVSPMELTLIDSDESIVFDATVPTDMQLQFTGLHWHSVDGYGKIIGSSAEETAIVLSAHVPQRKGEIDGGADIPLIYILIYDVNEIENPQDYVFIRGQLLTFEQMEQYKIYEDGQYVCYDASELFYTDLRQYVESMVSQRSDIYFDEQVWGRVQNIYNYYRENTGTLLGYRTTSTLSQGLGKPVIEDKPEQSHDNPGNSVTGQDYSVGEPKIEGCYDDPDNPVTQLDYSVGEPNIE